MNLLKTVLLLAVLVSSTNLTFGQETRKVAFLVGVEEYERRGFSNLQYAEDDMQALHDRLVELGFEVELLLSSSEDESNRANKECISAAINERLLPQLRELRKQDVVLIAVAGHGRHQAVVKGDEIVEDHYFCPSDAHDSDSKTWISISKLITQIEENSGCENNLIMVDACRDNPSRGRGVDGKGFSLNRDAIAILFASSYAEQAYEPEELGHGLFTYYVLEALGGAAANTDQQVDWDSLVGYVKGRVQTKSEQLLADGKIAGVQRPNAIGNLRGKSPVLVSEIARRRPALLRFPFTEEEARDSVASWAESLEEESVFRTDQGHEMVLIPPGEFMMGNEESVDEIMEAFSFMKGLKRSWFEDAPQHRVEITEPFFMSSTEVTVGQFRAFVEATGYQTDAEKDGKCGYGYDSEEKKRVGPDPEYTWKSVGWTQSDRHPVVNVSWNDAVAYCEWLSKETGQKCGLPTEAQWEYACRAGGNGRYHFGDDAKELVRYANVWDTSTKEHFPNMTNQLSVSDRMAFSSPVGRYRSNSFGLKDMHGNVIEWCNDWYSGAYYDKSPVRNTAGRASGSSRVLRGGSWVSSAANCRSADRNGSGPAGSADVTGFRVVLLVR